MTRRPPGNPPCPLRRLPRPELPVDTVALARFLIGKVLVHELPGGRLSGRIVETEAYPVGDPSGHAYAGATLRNRSLFLEPGHAYVYLAYGRSYLLNISSEPAGVGAGVLLRALEPLAGIAAMTRRRGGARLLDLARGPGRLTMALGIGPEYDGADLCGGGLLWLADALRPPGPLGASGRVGLSREADRRLRFYERGNPFVSGPQRLRA